MGEVQDAFKRTCFWLSLLWFPILGFSIMSYLGGIIPIAGLILPFSIMVVFAVGTCITVVSSGMLQEDKEKGDAGVVASVLRASTQSMGGRKGSRDDLGQDMSRASSGMSLEPNTYGQGQSFFAETQAASLGVSMPQAAARGASAPQISGPAVDIGRWQVSMDAGSWVDFEEAQQRAFSTALMHGLDKVEYTVAHQRYELIFASQVQRNIRTGKERPVRCVTGDEPPSSAPAPKAEPQPPPRAAPPSSASAFTSPGPEWQVQMDSGKWIDMDAVTNTIINDANSRGDESVFFRTHGQDIELTFASGTQRNTKTGKERPVRQKPRVGGGPGGATSPGAHPMPVGDSTNPPEEDPDGGGRVQM